VVGIGIGHNVEDFYRNAIILKTAEELGNMMIEKISEML
jgi:cobalamin biosynthesis protein CobT